VTAATSSSGTVAERYVYSPFGNITFLSPSFAPLGGNQSAIGNTVTYTGRQYDAESGLYYYRNRYYDGALGGFLSRDPTDYDVALNLYAYCYDDPVGSLDPTGLDQFCRTTSKTAQIDTPSHLIAAGVIGPIPWTLKVKFRGQYGFTLNECQICCPSGAFGTRTTVSGFVSDDIQARLTAGWDYNFDWNGWKVNTWGGVQATASFGFSASIGASWTSCKGDRPSGFDVCVTPTTTFGIRGGAEARIQTDWYSVTIGASVGGTLTYRVKICSHCDPSSGCSWPTVVPQDWRGEFTFQACLGVCITATYSGSG
jgi:RHS repeat-associated protein